VLDQATDGCAGEESQEPQRQKEEQRVDACDESKVGPAIPLSAVLDLIVVVRQGPFHASPSGITAIPLLELTGRRDHDLLVDTPSWTMPLGWPSSPCRRRTTRQRDNAEPGGSLEPDA
jgi:hypothetical protein